MLNLFRDAGMEVIYTGRYQSEEGVANAAIAENVDAIAVSDLTGSMEIICRKIIGALKEKNAGSIKVFAGGLITDNDKIELAKLGVVGCFSTGADAVNATKIIQEALAK
jgi:methylmalonyl-CoA mutase C-terminal domain/subunit